MVDIGVCQIAIKRPFTIPLKIFEESTIAALAVYPPLGDFEVFENILCYRLPTQGIKLETLVGIRARFDVVIGIDLIEIGKLLNKLQVTFGS